MKLRRLLKSRWIPVAAVAVLFSLILGAAYACKTDQEFHMAVTEAPFGGGTPVTVERARASSWTFGELPAMELADPCTGKVSRLTLLAVKAGYRGRLFAVYTHGLRVQFVNKAFPPQIGSPYDGSRRVTIHGQPGLMTSRGTNKKWFWCGGGFSCADVVTDPAMPGAKHYPNSARVGWIENGSEISLEGPFADSVLLRLAEQLRLDAD